MIELQQEPIALKVSAAYLRLAHERHLSGCDLFVVLFEAEGVHEKCVVQRRDGAASDSRILLVGNCIFLNHKSLIVLTFRKASVERPKRLAVEDGVFAAGKHTVDDLIVTVLLVIIDDAKRLLKLFHRGV